MIIQHNIMSLNSYNRLSGNNSLVSKNLEKLSSGYKINRAGDDAAGLAISEKMRAQITGLDRAKQNSQDGISLVQTAEGQLTEVHSMLNRMVDLATQASNGTYDGANDRANLQKEVDSLKAEINRIAETSNFNGIKLLDGSLGSGRIGMPTVSGINTTNTAATKNLNTSAAAVVDATDVIKLTYTGTDGKAQTVDLTGVDKGDAAANFAEIKKQLEANADFNKLFTVGGNAAAMTFEAKGAGASTAKVTGFGVATTGNTATATASTANTTGADASVTLGTLATVGTTFKLDGVTYERTNAATDKVKTTGAVGFHDFDTLKAKLEEKGYTTGASTVLTAVTVAYDRNAKGTGLNLQIGDTADQRVSVRVNNMGVSALGLDTVDVSEEGSATASMQMIKDAINSVSSTRADLGAIQNRLEHTVNNLTTTTENMTAAESRIRDTDMAKEMMAFTKNNVLAQAAQAMLAQANQQPQQVLQLLR